MKKYTTIDSLIDGIWCDFSDKLAYFTGPPCTILRIYKWL